MDITELLIKCSPEYGLRLTKEDEDDENQLNR